VMGPSTVTATGGPLPSVALVEVVELPASSSLLQAGDAMRRADTVSTTQRRDGMAPHRSGQLVAGTRPSRPALKSSNACCSSARVFITNGP
jgi:hypothetical protein